MLSFLWKNDTFLAVYSTLLNSSYVGLYLQKTTTEKMEKKDKVLSRTRLYALIPYRYTAEADCVTLGKSLLFNAFSMELSPATAFKDDRAASTELLTVKKKKTI